MMPSLILSLCPNPPPFSLFTPEHEKYVSWVLIMQVPAKKKILLLGTDTRTGSDDTHKCQR